MADDYRVKARSDLEVRELAKKMRTFFGVSEHRHVDILACLEGQIRLDRDGREAP